MTYGRVDIVQLRHVCRSGISLLLCFRRILVLVASFRRAPPQSASAERPDAGPDPAAARAQDEAYRNSVLPPDVTARVSIEAGTTFGWSKFLGTHGKAIGVDHFGASAPAPILYKKYGITKDAVVEAAQSLMK